MIKDTTYEKYSSDPAFRTIVDALQSVIASYELTPSELRQAVMYACYLHEMRTVRPVFIPKTQWFVMDKNDLEKESK